MEIVIMPKIGFCYGVERSINLTNEVLKNYPNKSLNLLGMLVHNDIVNEEMIKKGFNIIDINNLENVLKETNNAVFITTAHGISIVNEEKIKNYNFPLINTTCPIVLNNNKKIYQYFKEGYDIIYIGRHNHQESNVIKNYVHLIENEGDLNNLNIKNEKVVLTNQTTVSITELNHLTNLIKNKYKNIVIDTCICPATKERQDKILELVKIHNQPNDKWIIIGDTKSNNTKKLVEIIKIYTTNYYFINCLKDIDHLKLSNSDTIYVASGTSTPNNFIYEVIDEIKKRSEF